MKPLMAFILAATLTGYGQTASTGLATTKGSCSPAVTGSGNTINIKTCGMTREQTNEFRSLLKQILANQANANDLIPLLRELKSGQLRIENGMVRIEGAVSEIQQQSAPRVLSADQQAIFSSFLKSVPAGKLKISASINAADASAYANQIAAVLRKHGWSVETRNAMFGPRPGMSTPTGMWITVKDPRNPPIAAAVLQQAFRAASIEVRAQWDPDMVDPLETDLSIGVK